MVLVMMMIACSDKMTPMERRAERAALVCYSGSSLIYASELTVDERPDLMFIERSGYVEVLIVRRKEDDLDLKGLVKVFGASCVHRQIEE